MRASKAPKAFHLNNNYLLIRGKMRNLLARALPPSVSHWSMLEVSIDTADLG